MRPGGYWKKLKFRFSMGLGVKLNITWTIIFIKP